MGLMDAIAALGLAGEGFDAADKKYKDRDYLEKKRKVEEEVNNMALADAKRKDELAKAVRDAVSSTATRPAALGLDIATPAVNDPYQEHVRIDKGFDVPEGANPQAVAKAASDALLKGGDAEGADKYRKALKAMEEEGYRSIVVGVAAGRDPKEIAEEFNKVGKKRIVNGTVDPGTGTYILKFEDGSEQRHDPTKVRELASALGWMKKPDLHNVPAGSTVLADGKPMYTAPMRPEARRNIDPLSPEGIAATKNLEAYKSTLKKVGEEKATELQRNVKFLVESGIAGDEGEAFDRLRTSMTKDRGASVSELMKLLKPDTFSGKADQVEKLRSQAESLYDSLHGSPAAAKPKRPPKAAAPASDETPPTEGARKAQDGKWYVQRNGQWFRVD